MACPFPTEASSLVRDVDSVLESIEHEYSLMSLLEMSYKPLHKLGLPGYEEPFLPDFYLHLSEGAIYEEIYAMQKLCYTEVTKNKKNPGFPPGHWYMVTITQKDSEDESNIMRLHDKALGYFSLHKIEPYVAALEKSNIYHVHYICRFPQPKKNEQRDLTRLLGRRVRIEKRVNTLHQWNGLNKYIKKDGYDPEKADTSLKILISHITYVEGKGYILDK